jgi:alkylation response protein AidB-like acyl-CoA dehydrogenase
MTHVAPLVSAIEDTALLNLSRTFAACAVRIDREASFPFANIGRLRGAGLLALTIPKRYGGPGAGASETDYGLPTSPNESALIKAMVIENAIRTVELAASLAGNHAHARVNAIERHIRDVRSGRVQALQADASFVTAGRGVLL